VELDDLASRLVIEGTREGSDPEIAVNLALIARFYERLGDHAVNLARRIDVMAAPRRLTRFTAGSSSSKDPVDATDLKEKRGGLRKVLHSLSKFRVVPKDDAFFELFRAAADNARDCAGSLAKLVAATDGIDDDALDAVRICERRGDEITIDLLRRLDASFVTPYDREDIHALAEELDDVVDDMFSAATVLQLARNDRRPPELMEIAEVIVTMCDEMLALIDCLETKDGARFRLERIEHLERQGDAIYQRGLASLFNGDYEALEVIKLKDILHSLEGSCNAVEDVSDVVESILVKNS
jgi:predicted phosphate transport protein (TIGR00153 family)